MRAIFVDNQTGRLLEMAEDNKKDTIISVIESMVDYDKNIRVVTTDMANGYRSAIQTCLPNAKIVVDKFHVFQALHTRISTTKKGIMKNINDQIKNAPTIQDSDHLRAVRDLINGNPYLFKFGRKKISANQKRLKALADACATFPELNHLRLIKEGVERIYDSATRQEAEARYEDWRKLIPPSGKQKIAIWEKQYGVRASVFSAEFASFDRMMSNWHEEIFAYFDPGCRVTNAVAEGTNNMI
jgi:transposase